MPNYVEPFFGSGAVLLSRPHWTPDGFPGRIHVECVNDVNGWLQNFWRSVKFDAETAAFFASQPVAELDLHARGNALFYRWKNLLATRDALGCSEYCRPAQGGACPLPDSIPGFVEWMRSSPAHYCPLAGGWWAWGQSSWIGNGWGRQECKSRPHLGGAGHGVDRQLPQLGNAGRGVNRQLPQLGNAGKGECERHLSAIIEWFSALSSRLRHVDICCGGWTRVLSPTLTEKRASPCAIFLDPPYSQEHGLDTVYGDDHDSGIAAQVRVWCLANGGNKKLRIALCGYDTEHGELESHGWDVLAWKTRGGYGGKNSRGTANATRERIWFSPGCPGEAKQTMLF